MFTSKLRNPQCLTITSLLELYAKLHMLLNFGKLSSPEYHAVRIQRNASFARCQDQAHYRTLIPSSLILRSVPLQRRKLETYSRPFLLPAPLRDRQNAHAQYVWPVWRAKLPECVIVDRFSRVSERSKNSVMLVLRAYDIVTYTAPKVAVRGTNRTKTSMKTSILLPFQLQNAFI